MPVGFAAQALDPFDGNNGRVDPNYHLYDNDADNFDPLLSSASDPLAYVTNPDDDEAYGEDRWKTGGGIDHGGHSATLGAGGKSRDADGSVDRVRDPPKHVLPLLYALRMQAEAYNIGLEEAFEAAGGTHYGTIPATKFGSCLFTTFHRLGLTEEQILALTTAYGCGDKVAARSARSKIYPYELCAWKDLCEDVEKAVDVHKHSQYLPDAATRIYPRGVRY